MKKIRFLPVILCFLFFACFGAGVQADAPAVTFRLSDAEGKPGERIHLSITVTSTEDINSIALYNLNYDSSVLTFEGFDNYSEIESKCMFPGGMDEEKKVITLALRKSEELNAYICDLQFTVRADTTAAEASVSLTSLAKNNSDVIPSEAESGTVFIRQTTVTHTHEMQYISARESTCIAAGQIAHWRCGSCSKNFSDQAGTLELSDVTIPRSSVRHEGGYYTRSMTAATLFSTGYTGDLHCQGCGALVQKGTVIPKLQNSADSFIPYEPIDPPTTESSTPSAPTASAAQTGSSAPGEEKPTPLTIKPGDDSWQNPFADISKTDPWYAAVRCMHVNNLFRGVSDTEFAPQTTMTRAMFVTVLGRLAGVQEKYGSTGGFRDVDPYAWYAPYVTWAEKYGIVTGYGNDQFGVNDEITVEQAAVILARYAAYAGMNTDSDITLIQYDDAAQISDWAEEAMLWVVEKGIYVGEGYMLSAKKPSSRALVAMMLYAYVENVEG